MNFLKFLPHLISSAAGIGSGFFDYYSQKQTNDFNRNMAREQMQFQERMSNSAYQRATEDMKKAGINPMLAYSQGGASSPPGSSAVMQNPASRGIHSALATATTHATLKNMDESNRKIQSDTELNKALTRTAQNDAIVKANTARQIATQTELLNFKKAGARIESDIDSKLYGQISRYIGRSSPLVNTAIAAARAFYNGPSRSVSHYHYKG